MAPPPSVLTFGWLVLVAVGLAVHRPRRTRPLPRGGAPAGRPDPLARLGSRLRGVLHLASDPTVDRLVGLTALATASLALVAAPVAPLAPLGGAALARLRRVHSCAAERRRWSDALPDTVDLFSVALASGLSVPSALPLVASRAAAPLGPALATAEVRFRHGEPLAVALERVADEAPVTRPLVAVLVSAHCDGAPTAEPLGRLAADLRLAWQREAETRARQVPIRLLFPLVGCTLPAFVLITVVPAIVSALGALQL